MYVINDVIEVKIARCFNDIKTPDCFNVLFIHCWYEKNYIGFINILNLSVFAGSVFCKQWI